MSTSKVVIDFVTQYTGRANVNAAKSDMEKLGAAAKKLGIAFSVGAVVEFGKSAVEAFTKADQQFKVLSKTLSNLGLESQSVGISDYINKLAMATGTVKESLIPALEQLATYTHDVTKAQDLLQLSLDVSAGTGKDLTTVTAAIGKAYGGNTTALGKLGAGISQTMLKSKNFVLLQQQLNATFGGDAAAAADTYAGRIQRLGVAFTQLQENFGQGLIEAFSGANSSATDFSNTLQTIANFGTTAGAWTGGLIRGIEDIGKAIGKIPGLNWVLSHAVDGWDKILGVSKSVIAAHDQLLRQNDQLQQKATADAKSQAAIAKNAAKAQAAADASTVKAAKDKLALERAALSLKLAGNTTDMQNIEIQAALQRGQTEQVTNVLLLQRAIITGNADQANILAEEVLKANGLVMDVNGNISTLANAKDPFKDWPPATAAAMTQLKAIQDALAAIKDKTVTVTVNTVYTNSGGAGGSGGSSGGSVTTTIPKLGNAFEGAPIVIPSSGINQGNPNALGNANEGAPISYMPVISTVNPSITQTNNPLNPNGANEGAPINVLVTLNGQTVGNAITDAQVNQSASGIANSFQRSGYGSGALPW
jgi:hypothetical protein